MQAGNVKRTDLEMNVVTKIGSSQPFLEEAWKAKSLCQGNAILPHVFNKPLLYEQNCIKPSAGWNKGILKAL